MLDFYLGCFVSNRIARKQIQNEIVEKDFDETFEFLQGTKRKFYRLINTDGKVISTAKFVNDV